MQYPKPTKQERVNVKQAQRDALQEYRSIQAALAILRDHHQCVFCWFLEGVVTHSHDVHHVYSRGREAGDWREKMENLLCTCRKHHPQPIKVPGANPNLAYVEDVRIKANETPINRLIKGVNVERPNTADAAN